MKVYLTFFDHHQLAAESVWRDLLSLIVVECKVAFISLKHTILVLDSSVLDFTEFIQFNKEGAKHGLELRLVIPLRMISLKPELDF